MTKPIFYFARLKTWDKVTMSLYALLSISLWHFFSSAATSGAKRDILLGYAFGTQFFLYFVNYKSLRNLSVYFFWIGIGILHLAIYFHLKDVTVLQGVKIHAAAGLRNTIILLVLFQFLQVVSAKTQGQLLVCPSRSSTDLFEKRQVTAVDNVLFFIYMLMTVVLSIP